MEDESAEGGTDGIGYPIVPVARSSWDEGLVKFVGGRVQHSQQPGRFVRPERNPSGAKPLGQPTRGKTARNRLRQVDHFMLLYDPGLLTRRDGLFDEALFVDLGYGEEPFTALESAERLRRLNPALKILGVEIDPERVARAQPYADADTFFRLGGFNLPLTARESVRAIRAFNVLRQYEEADVFPAWERMAGSVLPGGLLVEGTSNPTGGIWAANVLRRSAPRQGLFDGSAWTQEALVFFTNELKAVHAHWAGQESI